VNEGEALNVFVLCILVVFIVVGLFMFKDAREEMRKNVVVLVAGDEIVSEKNVDMVERFLDEKNIPYSRINRRGAADVLMILFERGSE